jgi:hypothetical protein
MEQKRDKEGEKKKQTSLLGEFCAGLLMGLVRRESPRGLRT